MGPGVGTLGAGGQPGEAGSGRLPGVAMMPAADFRHRHDPGPARAARAAARLGHLSRARGESVLGDSTRSTR